MFLYPLAISLIALTFLSGRFGGDQAVFAWTTGFTAAGAIFDFLRALPDAVKDGTWIGRAADFGSGLLPFSAIGFGWIWPAVIGFAIGMAVQENHFHNECDCRIRQRYAILGILKGAEPVL